MVFLNIFFQILLAWLYIFGLGYFFKYEPNPYWIITANSFLLVAYCLPIIFNYISILEKWWYKSTFPFFILTWISLVIYVVYYTSGYSS